MTSFKLKKLIHEKSVAWILSTVLYEYAFNIKCSMGGGKRKTKRSER